MKFNECGEKLSSEAGLSYTSYRHHKLPQEKGNLVKIIRMVKASIIIQRSFTCIELRYDECENSSVLALFVLHHTALYS